MCACVGHGGFDEYVIVQKLMEHNNILVYRMKMKNVAHYFYKTNLNFELKGFLLKRRGSTEIRLFK